MLGDHQHEHGQHEVVRAVDPEVEPGPGIDVVQVGDREESVPRSLVDLHHHHLEHQRQPEDRRREAEEAEAGHRVVERRVLA